MDQLIYPIAAACGFHYTRYTNLPRGNGTPYGIILGLKIRNDNHGETIVVMSLGRRHVLMGTATRDPCHLFWFSPARTSWTALLAEASIGFGCAACRANFYFSVQMIHRATQAKHKQVKPNPSLDLFDTILAQFASRRGTLGLA